MKKILVIVSVIIVLLVAACSASIWISYNYLTVSEYTITSNQIITPFRMVLISDLHNHQFGEENEELVQKIREQSPDLIIVDGDMLNADSKDDSVAVELVRDLVKIAPVYYSYGNHEIDYINAGNNDLQGNLERAGAVILNYQCMDMNINGNEIRLGGLYEYGFDTGMQSEEENQLAMAYKEIFTDTDRYMIMCAHRPDSFCCWDTADEWGVDMVLSGHLHGGQVIIPGIGGLYSQLEQFFPNYDYGQYKLGDCDMIITRGLGSNPKVLPRLNNPPEIVVVDIEVSNKK